MRLNAYILNMSAIAKRAQMLTDCIQKTFENWFNITEAHYARS